MIASLGMYDRAETAPALDRFWAVIRDGFHNRGIAAPEGLTRGAAAFWPAWQSPELVFSQTCGLPFRSGLLPDVALIGTPDFGVPGCQPGHYTSVFVVRADETRPWPDGFHTVDFAYNEGLSQSGWAAAHGWFTARNLRLRPVRKTGSHRQSALDVLHGHADFAALDFVTWSLLRDHEDWTDGLRVVGQSDPTPALPYITAKGGDTRAMFDAVAAAIAEIGVQDRATLHLRGIVAIPASAYLAVPLPPAPADFIART